MNQLKQGLNDFRKGGVNLPSADLQFNRVIDSMTDGIDKYVEVRTEGLGIGEMNKKYRADTEFIKEIKKDLSLNDRASVDTAVRKLMSTLRTNNEFRLELLQQLEAKSGTDIISGLAGLSFNPKVPRGLAAQVAAGGGAYLALSLGALAKALPFLLTASPRLVGEFLRFMGQTAAKVDRLKINKVAAPVIRGARAIEASRPEPVLPP